MAKYPAFRYGKMNRGWFNARRGSDPRYESYRHTLARYGIKTRGLNQEELKQKLVLVRKQQKKQEKNQEDKPRYTWKSIYDAPVDKIVKEFREAYGKKPTDEELNDILLGGEW